MAQVEVQGWRHDLFDCFSDCGLCCTVSCCGPCAYGQLVNLFKTGDVGGFCGSECCMFCLVGLIPYCGQCVQASMSGQNRTNIRMKYKLPEEPCNDCCVHYWCWCCAVIQETREVTARLKDGEGTAFSGAVTTQMAVVAAPAGVQQMQVEVPPGIAVGQAFTIQAPDGQQMQVQALVSEGQMMMVQMPVAAVQPVQAVPAAVVQAVPVMEKEKMEEKEKM